MKLSFKQIASFLNMGTSTGSRLISYLGLGIGVLLLLCSMQMFININVLLKDRNPRTTGFDYISITKKITDQNVGHDNSFSTAEITALQSLPFIEDATPLIANKFVVSASGGPALPFTTDIFLEAIKTDFIDTIPPSFTWQPGQAMVPIIISSDYLELYNTVFAPSRDLPQISEGAMGALVMQLECTGVYGTKIFRGNIVALSDRINSVIVPKNFLEWANKNVANISNSNATRVYIKTTDANNVEFLNYLQKNDYQINKDKTKFGRVKQLLQAVVSGLGGFAVLVILLAMMLFSFYLQLMIARSKDNLQLLLALGYSPNWLSKTVAQRWVPIYLLIILVPVLLVQLFQYFFIQQFLHGSDDLSPFIHWTVLLTSAVLMGFCIYINYQLIRKLLNKL
ncbi:MAG: hypothetical protein WEA59_00485 [Ferruginibacter sp.]